ncbi:peptide chain release factor N(5)-glutamine methyltransferase [Pontibacter cellulosilyticus]|uniref:Release factor glutamine methyltransferase n=1 Tax=Pontibacter cellulosilyticus TaxID=1720253 RepID=A0A923N8Q1_9BACT|nr:peptide chain release factor N(5)-glutamine methyltransferase [Pontibacter cellulosilyticus]MBC5994264.1 peptide chain release factor N(5)-glutamine methyltransferase [Pontibacter cellulosilyticus]
MATVQETRQYIRENIQEAYPEPEAGAIAQRLLEHVLQKSKLELSLKKDKPLTQEQEEQVKQAVTRLQESEPIQYVLEEVYFYDLDLFIDKRALIPRPETEELVDLVVKEHAGQRGLHVLDICTGSGCIPLALAANLNVEQVYGLEVSNGALEVAQINATKYNLPVRWLHQDVFEPVQSIAPASLDILTSNPPYVLEMEKEQMRANVLKYEPHLALFVLNNDPLRYYKRITELGLDLLKEGGKLYFEINERYGQEVKQLLLESGYKSAEVIKDLFGKDRMVKAVK